MRASYPHDMKVGTPEDADAIAKLIDIAGEGIPTWLWAQECQIDQQPLEFGAARAAHQDGGFSYTNTIMAKQKNDPLGMVLSYPINEAPDDDLETLPDPIKPFIELEKQSVGTWYINALAVFPDCQLRGIGTALLDKAEEIASSHRCSAMSIQVYEQNTGAVRLYKRHGYKQLSSAAVIAHPCHPYYTGDVLLLTKSI